MTELGWVFVGAFLMGVSVLVTLLFDQAKRNQRLIKFIVDSRQADKYFQWREREDYDERRIR